MKTIIEFLKTEGALPKPFGLFHITVIMLTTASVLFSVKKIPPEPERVRRLLLAVSLVTLILEIYKQLALSLDYIDGRVVFNYKWHIFPWQFCSTPMFAGTAAALVRSERLHRALTAYLASFALVAGLIITLLPFSTFSAVVGINIQTSFCHGSMVVLGSYLLLSGYVSSDRHSFRGALGIFLLGAVIAAALNQAAYLIGIPEGEVFNMYFISPYFPEDVPVLAPLRRLIPDPFFQFVYLLAFTLAAYFVMKLASKRKPRASDISRCR